MARGPAVRTNSVLRLVAPVQHEPVVVPVLLRPANACSLRCPRRLHLFGLAPGSEQVEQNVRERFIHGAMFIGTYANQNILSRCSKLIS